MFLSFKDMVALKGKSDIGDQINKKIRECLEYIVVHEMAHLLEPTHNGRFVALMDLFIPQRRFCREALNRLPVRNENLGY